MPAAEVVAALAARVGAVPFTLGVDVSAPDLLVTLRALRDVHGYRYYVCASATDRSAEFELLHGVRNLDTNDDIWVRVHLPRDAPEVDSAAHTYAGAEWQEREIFDLFGLIFRAHPDPRRLMLPDQYVGHPLRKDFPIDTPWGYRPATVGAPVAEPEA